MKFKKLSWFKRIFQDRSEDRSEIIEYIGTTTIYSQLIWSKNKNYFEVAVYKTFNPKTNEIYKIWSMVDGEKVIFNKDAFIKDKKLILE